MCKFRAVTPAAGTLTDVAEKDWTARIGALVRRAEAMLAVGKNDMVCSTERRVWQYYAARTRMGGQDHETSHEEEKAKVNMEIL